MPINDIESEAGRNLLRRLSSLVLCTVALFSACAGAVETKPNIVLILLDNFGYGELGAYGGGVLRGAPTRHIDTLAREGTRLTNFNTEPWCIPSRAALMTGRFAVRVQSEIFAGGSLAPSEITLAEMLREAGYVSAHIGKWHLGGTPGHYPTDQGFDEWWGITGSSEESTWMGSLGYDPKEVPPPRIMEGLAQTKPRELGIYDLQMRSRFDGEVTRRGIEFVRRQAEARRPFFAYLAMTTGHFPKIPSPEWEGKSGNGPWADVLAQLDYYVGQLLDTIKAAGIEKETVFILTADNGAESRFEYRGGGAKGGSAGPWRGSYGTAMEGGLRVPFIIRWPGKIPNGMESDEIVHLVDLFPTLARIAGGKLPKDRVIDGVDQLDFLAGRQQVSNRDFFPIYSHVHGYYDGGKGAQVIAAKWKHWKVHFYRKIFFEDPFIPQTTTFNLLEDPREEHSVLFADTWVLHAVSKRIAQFEATLASSQKIGPREPHKR